MSLRRSVCFLAGSTLSFATSVASHAPDRLPARNYDATNRCGGVEKHWFTAADAPQGDLVLRNALRVSRTGKMRWNGQSISRATLRKYTLQAAQMTPVPGVELGLDDSVPCDLVNEIRESFAISCSRAACIEFSEAEWRKYHAPPPPCDADCRAYGRTGGSFKGLSEKQKARLKRNYIDKYGIIPW